jgi:thiamine biosynthesis protein ThiS
MLIRLNGKDHEVKEGITVTQLLEALKIQPERVAVVVNQEIVKKASYASTILQGGDRVEVLTVMAGGVEENHDRFSG